MRILTAFLLLYCFFFPAYALESEVQKAEYSSARMIIGDAQDVKADGQTTRVVNAGVDITLVEGWKTYWRSPGDAGFPLEVSLEDSASNILSITPLWPYPHRFVEEWGLEVFGYKKHVLVPLRITLANAGSETQADIAISYAVCSDICINEQQNFSLRIPAHYDGNAQHAASLSKARESVPAENGSFGLTVESATIREEHKEGGVLAVTVSSESSRFSAPELFIESEMAGFRFPQAELTLEEEGKRAVFAVPYEISLPAKTLAKQTLTFTLVQDGKAIEHQLVIPAQADAAPVAGAALEGGAPQPALTDTVPAEPPVTDAAPMEQPDISLAAMVLLALLGGVILNIMPCVLPVLSVKMLGAVKHGGRNSREVRQSFLATVAGILVFFMVLAALTIAAKHAGHAVGWGFHFQSPQFLTFLVVLILLFAANLLGWFEIQLPAWLNTHIYDVTGSGALKHRHHLVGDFATGAFAALMATPCTAPFLGTAVGFALARGDSEILTIFFALGLGLSVPYLAAALVPALATRLPKPGNWMLRVKAVMGILLLLAAAWLLWVISGQAGIFNAAGVLLLSAMLGAVLHGGGRWRFLRKPVNVALMCLALVVTLALLPSLKISPHQEKHGEEQENSAELWQHFERARIAKAVAAGKVVFVDVTADWCLTCKFNKLRVLGRDDVQAALRAGDVLALQADMTRPMPDIQAYLKAYGRYGIPFNIVYGPAATEGIPLSEVLTAEEVLHAIDAARGS